MRNLLYLVTGSAALALVLASACTSETETETDGTGGSGAGTTSMGGNAGGSGGMGAGCLSCSAYLLSPDDTLSIADTCGFDAGTMECNSGSSCELVALVGLCTCGDGDMPMDPNATVMGMCEAECEFSCFETGEDAMNCQECATNNCAGATNDCLADMGSDGTP
jgi:hypothetical protein